MKRNRPDETEKLLKEAESSFRVTLLDCLPRVTTTGASLWVNSDFLPKGYSASGISDEGEALYQSACMCLRLRELVGLTTEGSVGALFVAACSENASDDEHRPGPRRLAISLMEYLGNDENMPIDTALHVLWLKHLQARAATLPFIVSPTGWGAVEAGGFMVR